MKRFVMMGISLVVAETVIVLVSLGQNPSPSPKGSPAQPGKPAEAAKFDEPKALRPIDRFDGLTTLSNARLKAAAGRGKVQMTLRNWDIPNRQRVDRFPEQGFLIVQVRSGEDLVTEIDGQRQQRKVEEFFTVPTGSTMSIETGNDTAIIQTLAIKEPGKAPAKK